MVTYRSRLMLNVTWSVNDGEEVLEVREAGQIPIMLKSNRCHLENYHLTN